MVSHAAEEEATLDHGQAVRVGYGPFILVTQAHSTSIANWEGSGDAVIGIHGPLGADSVIGTTGAYLSHGCIRIPIPYLVQFRDVPAGSPISVCGQRRNRCRPGS